MTKDVRPRILLLTRNLPPLVGGMEKLNWHLVAELAKVAEVRVVAPRGAANLAPPGVDVVEVALRPLWTFLLQVCWHALREGRRWRPGVVFAGSGLTAVPALLAARVSHASAGVYAHGLDLAVPHFFYRHLWFPALRRMDRVIANSGSTAKLAMRIGIVQSRIRVVHPGVELPSRLPDASEIQSFRSEHGLGARPLLLSVGRLSARKGLREFVTLALPQIVASFPDVVLLVVGDAPNDALHAQAQTPESIYAAAGKVGVARNLKFLGTITDYDKLGAVYAAADVHVFPVRELPGDPEGFGMVAIEAAAHGLPTVAFETGGVTDAVSDGDSGCLVPPGDYVAFARAVVHILTKKDDSCRSACIAFANRFAWPAFGEQIIDQLPGLLRTIDEAT